MNIFTNRTIFITLNILMPSEWNCFPIGYEMIWRRTMPIVNVQFDRKTDIHQCNLWCLITALQHCNLNILPIFCSNGNDMKLFLFVYLKDVSVTQRADFMKPNGISPSFSWFNQNSFYSFKYIMFLVGDRWQNMICALILISSHGFFIIFPMESKMWHDS